MSPALNYLPAYLGLFAAQILAITCNAFLDIQYGIFGTEVLIWSIAFAISLRIGRRQHGVANEDGSKMMRRFLIFGALVSVIIFIPMWGFPRAGIYILGALQVSYNCVTTTRRHLHMGLLMSLVMVIFATSHYRADWTMLFYLVPYVAAVVFTLVAEQINRKTEDLRQQSSGNQIIGAQSIAIAAATMMILTLGLALYAFTPQATWASLSWQWGNPTNMGKLGGQVEKDSGGGSGNQSPGQGSMGSGGGQPEGAGNASGRWPTSSEMLQVASRKGMPEWQRDAINSMADAQAWVNATLKPIMQSLEDLWQALKKWLDENKVNISMALIILVFMVLLYALWRLLREAKVVTWLLSRLDYLRYGVLSMHAHGDQGVVQFYLATVRIFSLYDMERTRLTNTQEYLYQTTTMRKDLRSEMAEITRLFEDTRYGASVTNTQKVSRMKALYREVYHRVDI